MAETNLERLKAVLDELFMLDRADLDFGLYRIMNVRRDEVRRFLDHDLLPKVRDALGQMQESEHAATEAEMRALEKTLRAADVDPATSPKFRELEAKYHAGGDTEADEADVYGHLVSFFRRYYKEGDFISLRRYKEGVYAIPYEGEEVKLHWANTDQYYIKSTEQFRDYTFLVSHEDEPERRVHFRLVDANTERNNNRAQAGRDRQFVLVGGEPVEEVDGELVVRFEYRSADGAKQDALNTEAEATVLGHEAANEWRAPLARDVRREGAKDALTLLRKHLNTYAAKNTFDYFIHKDLGGFLRRELDFYLKNEVLRLDDIDTDGATAATLDAQLRKVRGIRSVGLPIVEFLASLEEFQKRLWLKKKFVVETHWCVTLDRVPPELYAEVAANGRQREEWVRLFAIDELRGNLPAYTEPLTEAFLQENQYLVLDTSLFERDFTERLLAAIETPDGLDTATDGLLVHGENFQALNGLRERFREQIDCIHIDPPYNTSTSGFLYKNEYVHSSWLSLMANRISASRPLLGNAASFLCHIDENEYERLRLLFDDADIPDAGTVVWDKKNPMLGRKGVATQHEYVIWRSYADTPLYLTGAARGTILLAADEIVAMHGGVTEAARSEFARWVAKAPGLSGGERAYRLLNDDGRVYQSVGMGAPEYRTNPKFHQPLIHPVTGGECPAPPSGWSRSPETLQSLIEAGEIIFGLDESVQPRRKVFLTTDSRRQVPSVIADAGRGKKDVDQLGIEFPYCHPVSLYEQLLGAASPDESTTLDYFAGSGTTAHAIINLNREDGGQRKYILVEMGEYFDTVLKPRVLKAVYSKDWKDGKPVARDGVSQLIKVIRLESYEDTLTNLRVRRSEQQTRLLEQRAGGDFRDQYALRYWITEETGGSASLLDLERFEDPWSYTLEVGQGSAAETKPVTVDLIETFNYLLGLRVQHVDHIRGVTLVQGTLPPGPGKATGEKALVIWRNTREMDAEALDKFLWGQRINPRDLEFDVIYVNGDNHLENSRRTDETWKVRLIEDEFHRLMFETAEQERSQ